MICILFRGRSGLGWRGGSLLMKPYGRAGDMPSWRPRLTRRRFLGVAATASAGAVIAACAPSPQGPAATATPVPSVGPVAFDWRKHGGTTITALFTNNPQGEYLKSKVPDFEQQTGIKVNFQIIEPSAMRDKQNVEFAAGSSNIDVWHTFLNQEGVNYARAGWYESPEPYLGSPSLTAPDYDFADLKAALPLAQQGGKLVGIPMWVEVQPLYYNAELLRQASLSVPKTMEELEAAAKQLHAPNKGIYGWATRATSPLNTSSLMPPFYSLGATWMDAQGRAALNSREAIAALDWYGRMLRLYGPPSPDTVDIARWSDLFKAGKVAFAVDSPSFIGPFADAAKSAVAGKFDIAPWPAGPAGTRTTLWGWTMCIGKFSQRKEAAWYYIQYHTSKKTGLEISKTGVIPSRDSVAKSSEYQQFIAMTVPNLPAVRDHGLKNGVSPAFPQIETVAQARQIWGDAVVGAIQGKDVGALAAEANRKFQALLDK
jgi:multiple sugar transport system substrate-binding protein